MKVLYLVRPFRLSLVLSIIFVILAPGSGALTPASASMAFPPAIQRQLRQAVDQALTADVPGAIVGIWAPGRGTWTYAAGLADVATKRPAQLQDATRIGSITKTFVGTLVLQFVDEGKLSLDAPISRWVPTAPDAKHVTVRELLSHTSGIYNFTDDPGFQSQLLKHVKVQGTIATLAYVWQPQQLVAIATTHPLYFPPGTAYHYSNTNFIILGMLLEKLTGRTVADLLQAKILRPLHLTHTLLPSGLGLPGPYLDGYTRLPGKSTVIDVTAQGASMDWAAGGMISTLEDLRVWAPVLATGRLLSPALQQQRLAWTLQSQSTYGLAVMNMSPGFVGHAGSVPGYTTVMSYLPVLRATVVVMVNGDQVIAGTDPATALFNKVVSIPW
jgi:D-alanyl-D-alanine carboxypeptidase